MKVFCTKAPLFRCLRQCHPLLQPYHFKSPG